jgi:hypothetical protein
MMLGGNTFVRGWVTTAALLLFVTASVSAQTQTSPRRSFVPGNWQLDLEFFDPQRITVHLPGDDGPTTYWYLLYRVTNNTGLDVQYYPSFRLVTDTLEVVDGGDRISPTVYDTIFERHRREFPFFAPPWKVNGPLLQGTENSRVSAAVFRPFGTQAARFTIFISGLSGQTERITNPGFDPGTDESEDNPRFFILRRTLAIHYDLPGDLMTRTTTTPIRRTREWVMR